MFSCLGIPLSGLGIWFSGLGVPFSGLGSLFSGLGNLFSGLGIPGLRGTGLGPATTRDPPRMLFNVGTFCGNHFSICAQAYILILTYGLHDL